MGMEELIQQVVLRMERTEKALEALSRGPSISDEDVLLTSRQVAPMVGVKHPKTVEKWARAGILPCVRKGRMVRFRVGDVRRWVAQRKEG